MMGWRLAWKCFVAWRFGESSQQPTWPQVRQSRKCTHLERVFRHSSQPRALGVTSRIESSWAHASAMGSSLRFRDDGWAARLGEEGVQRRDDLRSLPHRGRDPFHRTRAHVADGEHAGPAGLEWPAIGADIRTGAHEPLVVERDVAAGQPIGVRLGAGEEEEAAVPPAPLLAPLTPADRTDRPVIARDSVAPSLPHY